MRCLKLLYSKTKMPELIIVAAFALLVIVLIRMWKKRTIRGKDVKKYIEYFIERQREKKRKIKEGDFEVYEED